MPDVVRRHAGRVLALLALAALACAGPPQRWEVREKPTPEEAGQLLHAPASDLALVQLVIDLLQRDHRWRRGAWRLHVASLGQDEYCDTHRIKLLGPVIDVTRNATRSMD